MTFIPPKTFAVGEILSAVDMNTFVRDNTADLNARVSLDAYLGRRYITDSTTWSSDDAFGTGQDTSMVTRFVFTLLGGGGAGGGAIATSGTTCSAGGGGGAGALVIFTRTKAQTATYTNVVIGAAGLGANGTTGGPGGSTQILATASTVRTAGGGQGGFVASVGTTQFVKGLGGPGGTPGFAPGDLAVFGAAGFTSLVSGSGLGSCNFGGQGASSQFGAGARPPSGSGSNGDDAREFGSGGSGAGNDHQDRSAAKGGDGSKGLCFIDMFI